MLRCLMIGTQGDQIQLNPQRTIPLDQKDMRKLLDLQILIYNTLLTTPHFIHCLHTLPQLSPSSVSKQETVSSCYTVQPDHEMLSQPLPASSAHSLLHFLPFQHQDWLVSWAPHSKL